ncbi:hypothetical protein Pth03_25180 [Planotetraspora thailandica]|uniref:Uncharacterized protein n=1 Tax=Planotetraspora thailandica TaxID=487172 RepID=A0A8J3UY09_9ACTN|nr:hypothetical protein [Planotetraspora thailandica]GII54129.1 hypothetical protein Pth03_25180 [Planotetraspora thailandica]
MHNPYENRYGSAGRPAPETAEPFKDRRDEHDGPGPIYSPAEAPISETPDPTGTDPRISADDGREPRPVYVMGAGNVDRHGADNAGPPETQAHGASQSGADVLAPDPTGSPRTATPAEAEADDSDAGRALGAPAGRNENGSRAGERSLYPTDEKVAGGAVETATPSGGETRLDADVERRWHEIKAQFVDDPRSSVEQAEALVEEAVTAFASRRRSLADRWKNSDGGDTETLRLALREYHTLLARLTGK